MPGSKAIVHGGPQQGKAPRPRKVPARRSMAPGIASHSVVHATSIPQSLARAPVKSRLAQRPTPKTEETDVKALVTVQASHNKLTGRYKREVGDRMLLNLPLGVESEDLENAIADGTDLTEQGSVVNVLWNIPCPHTETVPDPDDPHNPDAATQVNVFDTRGNMQRHHVMGFTVKNVYTTPIWVHANTPICKTNARETVIARFCGFYVNKKRVECVELQPQESAKYVMPMNALQPGQAFSEFVENGNTPQMAKGRTMMLAQMLIERPTDAASDGILKGGVLASIKPFTNYEYTDLSMEFKSVQDGRVVHVEPYAFTYSNKIDDLYGITSIAVTANVVDLKKRLYGDIITLQHCENNQLRLTDETTGKLVETTADGVMMTVPALGIVREGILECQFKGYRGYIYLWDTDLDKPLEIETLQRRPTGTLDDVEMTFAIDTIGVYNVNWGAFLENMGAAGMELIKDFL